MNVKSFEWTACLLFVAVSLLAAATPAEQPEVLLQAAMHKQTVEGDLEGAIAIYKKILAAHAANRAIAAKALVQMGRSYEKLGKEEARKAYERVLHDYADQLAEVVEARERLAVLQKPPRAEPSGMVTRRVWSGPSVDATGAPSADGRFLSITDWETGDLAVRDNDSGQIRRLTNKGTWFESIEFAMFAIPSPDSKQIAYAWFKKDLTWELRVVRTDKPEPRVLYSSSDNWYLQPQAWSPDGKQVLTQIWKMDGSKQLGLISVAEGSLRTISLLEWSAPLKTSFSPDGRFIVYDMPQGDSRLRDIFLLSLEDRQQKPLIQHSANDLFPLWTPDGKRIVFISDRSGTPGAWSIPIAKGRPMGEPELIKQDLGRVVPMGLTAKSSMYYGIEVGATDIYEVIFDPESGKVFSPATRIVERYLGSNSAPEWAPDGKSLCYISRRGLASGEIGNAVLVIRSENGEERELSPKLNGFSRPRWSSDGRMIVVTGRDRANRHGVYAIDPNTGIVETLVQPEPGQNVSSAAISPDNKMLYYIRLDSPSKTFSIVRRQFDAGKETSIYLAERSEFIPISLALSPDGSLLAFRSFEQGKGSTTLKVVSTSTGVSRDLFRVEKPETMAMLNALVWTADGKSLLFGRRRRALESEEVELWRISAEGGEPQKLDFAMDQIRDIRLHPEGRRLLFGAGVSKVEVWVMENFLPASQPKKKASK